MRGVECVPEDGCPKPLFESGPHVIFRSLRGLPDRNRKNVSDRVFLSLHQVTVDALDSKSLEHVFQVVALQRNHCSMGEKISYQLFFLRIGFPQEVQPPKTRAHVPNRCRTHMHALLSPSSQAWSFDCKLSI